MTNVLEKASSPHFFEEEEKLLFIYTRYFTRILDETFADFLLLELKWNFINNSYGFLLAIQNFIEFVPELLEQLRIRAILPFLEAYGKVGTYTGFAQACKGIFGDAVVIAYDDITPAIDISNIQTPINYLFVAEGRLDFNFLNEAGTDLFVTEDVFVPPGGLTVITETLKKFLPAEHSECVTITFSV